MWRGNSWMGPVALLVLSGCLGGPEMVEEDSAAIAGNRPPVGSAAFQRAVVSVRTTLSVSATDPERDSMRFGSLRIEDAYTGATVRTIAGGCLNCTRASYSWTPGAVGRYRGRVTVSDASGSTVVTFGIFVGATSNGAFLRGDVNSDGSVDITDSQVLIGWLVAGTSPAPDCLDAADVNDDGAVDVSDTMILPGYLFAGDPETLPAPLDECAIDPTADELPCHTLSAGAEGTCTPPPAFLRGDVDANGSVDITDEQRLQGWLFSGTAAAPACMKAADANDDGRVDLTDFTVLHGWLWNGDPAELPGPVGECGADPTDDNLTCATACE